MMFAIISSLSRATIHSAIPRVSQFVFIHRPRSLSGLRFAATGSSRSGCKWLFCLKSRFVILAKVFVRHCEILAQEITGALAVVFEAVELCEHEQALHDHCLEARFPETEVVGAGETGGRARGWSGCEDLGVRLAPVDGAVWANTEYF